MDKKEYYKQWYEKNREREIKRTKEYKDTHKEHYAELNKEWQKNNRESRTIYKRELVKANKEHYQELHKQWYNKNKDFYPQWREKNRDKINANTRKRIKEDLEFRLKHCLRSRLNASVKNKHGHTLKLVGCPINELIKYLENKFQEGMTWNNYGEWHIDHIRPCASFDLLNEDEQKKCFHYTNLQPLWAFDNMSKHNKWEEKTKETILCL